VRKGTSQCSVTASYDRIVHADVSVRIESGKKQVLMDGKRLEDRKNLLDLAACIVFCHEDLEFVSGSPERRRWFFDQTLSLFDPAYIDDLRKYRKILKSRNTLLKEGKTSLLDLLDEQLVDAGLRLTGKRKAVTGEFSSTFCPLYQNVSGISDVELRYYPSWKQKDFEGLAKHLRDKREVDLGMGTTMSGPHRDRFVFYREGMDYASNASTGQRRLLALALRSAQAKFYSGRTGTLPILLLDDVLLELDPEKRRRFISLIPQYDQAFFTFLPGEPYEDYAGSKTSIFTVKDGRLVG